MWSLKAIAGRVAVEIEGSGQQFLVVNTNAAPVTPRLIVRGWTDRDGFPPRHAARLKLNGISIMPVRMLTGGTWILEPDGSAKWGYLTGTWVRADGASEDPRLWVFDPYKMALDHWPPLKNAGPTLIIAGGGAPRAWTCRVEFPAGAIVKKFLISANAEQCRGSSRATPIARIYADPEMKTLVAERAINFADGSITFDQNPQLPDAFYLQITAKDVKVKNTVGLYWVVMWAELDAVPLPRLTLQPGINVITAEDGENSSHQWRILLEDKSIRDNPPLPPAEPLPDFVKNHRSRFRDKPVPAQKLLSPAEVFPLGFYDRLPTNRLDFTVDDMADMNCNAVHGSNMGPGPNSLGAALDLLERAGMRLVYQGGGSAALYYQHKGYFNNDVKREVEYNEALFKPAARKYVPLYRARPGLLAWSIAEEVPPDVLERMAPYYALMRELDPTHPPVFLHNNFEAAKNDLERNHPAAVTHDQYAFSLDPRTTGPCTLSVSINAVLGATKGYRQLCDAHDIPLWFMGQCFGEPSPEDYTRLPYCRYGGQRILSAAIMRMQGWAAIAEGARGLFFFRYDPYIGTCRDIYWRKTPTWDGVKALFSELKPLTPLLLRLKRTDDKDELLKPTSGSKLVARTFARRDLPEGARDGLYAVVFSLDDKERQKLALEGKALNGAEVVWDLKRRKPLMPDMLLEPGEGTLLWIGSKEQTKADTVFLEIKSCI